MLLLLANAALFGVAVRNPDTDTDPDPDARKMTKKIFYYFSPLNL
jgi:hypothetical protein